MKISLIRISLLLVAIVLMEGCVKQDLHGNSNQHKDIVIVNHLKDMGLMVKDAYISTRNIDLKQLNVDVSNTGKYDYGIMKIKYNITWFDDHRNIISNGVSSMGGLVITPGSDDRIVEIAPHANAITSKIELMLDE